MRKKHIPLFFCFFSGLIFNQAVCYAQAINLNDVAKFKFVFYGAVIEHEDIEVIEENNNWNSYQTLLKGFDWKEKKFINDSSKKFLQVIPPAILTELLTIIAKRDTSINVGIFNLETDSLINHLDIADPYLKPDLKPAQRAEFVRALKSPAVIKKALYSITHPTLMFSDRDYYSITIITKSNISYTITASSFADIYNMPWHIDNIKCYDPRISEIFELIFGNNKYAAHEKNRLYTEIDRDIYWTKFRTRFNWDDFKAEQPASFLMLKNTLTPVRFVVNERNNYSFNVQFQSSLLPRYVQINTYFKKYDTTAIGQCKRYEDTLVNAFKKDNFLFKYLKTRPDCTMILTPGRMGSSGKSTFREIGKYFPGIDSFDYKKTLYIQIHGKRDIESEWMLLPDNTLILLKYTGILYDTGELKFMNIKDDVSGGQDRRRFKEVCVVFDNSGKIIYNYGAGAGIVVY